MTSLRNEYYSKHYEANRDKILDYKKQFYAEKVKYRKQFQNIKLKGFSKIDSNRIIKKAISTSVCFVETDGKTMTPQEFYDAYDIKDFSVIEVDYDYVNNNELTIKLSNYYLMSKN
jgi:hypothetical protein